MAPNMHCSPLSIQDFVHTYMCMLITQKLQVLHVYGRSTYQTTALVSEMFIFWVRAAYEIQLAIYGFKHA